MNELIIGLQYGDEGKGRIVDYLSENFKATARFNGGNNAGHTLVVDGKTYKTSVLPSGVLRKKNLYIGNSVLLDLAMLNKEIEVFKDYITNLYISDKCHVILPSHKKMDEFRETQFKIGSTKQGISPCSEDKYTRKGIRLIDIIDGTYLSKLTDLEDENYIKVNFEQIRKYIVDINFIQHENTLFEGAQSLQLDIEQGDYPYVTSSHCGIGGLLNSFPNLNYRNLETTGVFKAYNTRVGTGPFITEIFDENISEIIVKNGKEFGTVTGRKRRVGWLDLVSLKYFIDNNNIDHLAITKLDIFKDFNTIKICKAYEGLKAYSSSLKTLEGLKPIYDEIIVDDDYKSIIKYIELHLEKEIRYISSNAERNEIRKIY